MIKYLKEYIREIEKVLESEKKNEWGKVLENHWVQIGIFQHERLIHLLVTLTFGLGFLMMMGVTVLTLNYILILVDLLLLTLLIPYIFHYFKLENGVQKLYKLDKEIQNRI